MLASEERGEPLRQVVGDVQRANRREVDLAARDDELPQPLGVLEILEPMHAEIAQAHAIGQVIRAERARRIRQQDLPTMAGAGDTAGAVDVQPGVRIGCEARLPRVKPDPDVDRDPIRPGLCRQRALCGDRAADGTGRSRKAEEE